MIARRCAAVNVRVVRPESRISPAGPNTILAISASQARRCAQVLLLVAPYA
jgi:hypothetical protein